MRQEREQALAEQERRVEEFLSSRPPGTKTLDIPVVALEGARRYIVSRHLRTHSEDLLCSRVEEILTWMSCYAIPAGEQRWSTSPDALLPASASATAQSSLPGAGTEGRPERLPRGRHGLPPSVVARSQRNRLIAGTAEVMAAKGYANATIADIVSAAGVSRDVFYNHFADQRDIAFLEAQQFATQAILNTCAAAYFSVSDWPERVWRALDAMLKLIAEHPTIAHLRLVECYAAGEAAIRSIEEFVRAATIFLEGRLHVSRGESRTAAPVHAGDQRRRARGLLAGGRPRRKRRAATASAAVDLYLARAVHGHRGGGDPRGHAGAHHARPQPEPPDGAVSRRT